MTNETPEQAQARAQLEIARLKRLIRPGKHSGRQPAVHIGHGRYVGEQPSYKPGWRIRKPRTLSLEELAERRITKHDIARFKRAEAKRARKAKAK